MEKVEPKFKTTKKFIGFVSNLSGTRVNIVSEVAYFIPYKIYSMMDESIKLRFEIFPDNTVGVTNVGEVELNEDSIQKIIEDICESTVKKYADKNVFNEFKFQTDTNQICYLHTDLTKPIDVLRSVVGSKTVDTTPEVDESIEEVEVKSEEPNQINNNFNDYLKNSFDEINKRKVQELEKKVEKSQKDILTVKSDIKNKESNLSKMIDELNLNKKRLNNLTSEKSEPNGYFFHIDTVSQDVNVDNFSTETKSALDKICSSLKIDYNKLVKQVFSSYYKIYITKESELDVEEKTVDSEILEKIYSIDPSSDFVLRESYIEYWGDMSWQDLNKSMENVGFRTDSKFSDKIEKIKEPEVIEPVVKENHIEVESIEQKDQPKSWLLKFIYFFKI